MILDTALLDAARAKLREAEEEAARANERVVLARKEYEQVAQVFRAGASTIQLLLARDQKVVGAAPAGPSLLDEISGSAGEAPAVKGPPPPAAPAGQGIPRAVWDVIQAMPDGKEARTDNLREALQLSGPALNMRLARAKKYGLIETAGRGAYRLTEQGRAARGRRLQVVADD